MPHAQVGDSQGLPNIVGGQKREARACSAAMRDSLIQSAGVQGASPAQRELLRDVVFGNYLDDG